MEAASVLIVTSGGDIRPYDRGEGGRVCCSRGEVRRRRGSFTGVYDKVIVEIDKPVVKDWISYPSQISADKHKIDRVTADN